MTITAIKTILHTSRLSVWDVSVISRYLLSKVSPTTQARLLDSLSYDDFEPGEYIIREGVSCSCRLLRWDDFTSNAAH